MKEIVYLVSYSEGSYDDFTENQIFVTDNIDKAKSYVLKFNKMLRDWQSYFEKITIEEKDVANFNRHYRLSNINSCYFREVEKR